jgi:hypothetical protein
MAQCDFRIGELLTQSPAAAERVMAQVMKMVKLDKAAWRGRRRIRLEGVPRAGVPALHRGDSGGRLCHKR